MSISRFPVAPVGRGLHSAPISSPVAPRVRAEIPAPPSPLSLSLSLSLGGFAAVLLTLAAIVLAPAAHAQPRTPPHIGYAYPAGGQQGTTFTIWVGGQNLNGTDTALLSGPGITAEVTGYERPMTQKEFNDLRDKIQELMEKRAAAFGRPMPERFATKEKKAEGKSTDAKAKATPSASTPSTSAEPAKPDAPRPVWTEKDESMLADLRAQVAKRPNRQANPALVDTVTLKVTIAPDAAPGDRELRLKNPAGLSNPLLLQVGQLPEFTKPVVTATTNPPVRAKRDPSLRPTHPRSADMEVTLPATINGQILPGDVDRYRFAATKGQHLTVEVSARTLIPYLADAVPGWFQATVALYGPDGREVAYGDSYRFNPDPVVSYEIPTDGSYTIEVRDSIYRGREDFVYRIEIGELPFVTSIFPLGGRDSAAATFKVSGWNLPVHEITMDTKNKVPGTFMLSLRNRGQLSNPVRFALDDQAATLETEPNDATGTAQAITLPALIDGRIERAGDEDCYRFEGKAGTEVVAEVFARRLGSPLDSALRITDAAGHSLAFNDDYDDKGAGLLTHQADSRVMLKLPTDGTYFVRLVDAQHRGGPDYGYRLRIAPPRHDFELRVVPSSINARAGGYVPITVYALRRDGFNGEIRLALDDAPAGWGLAGAWIPAGQDKVQLTLAVPPNAGDQLTRVSVVGAATIDGQNVGHVAVPAEDMMQAFAYHHLVPARELLVNVSGRTGASRLLTRWPVKLTPGATSKIEFSTPAARAVQNVAIELSDAPEGITVKSSSVRGDTVEVVLAIDAAKVKPGTAGNLILNAFGERTNTKAKAKQQRNQRFPLSTVPAIPFEVIAAPVTTPPVAASR